MKQIKITVTPGAGCKGCVFHETRTGQSGRDSKCTGSWLMQKTAGIECTDGYKFTTIKVKEKK